MKLQGRALQQVAAAYALGSLSPRARRRFEAQLARDVLARRAWQQWESRLSALVDDPPPVRPPDNAWQTLAMRLQQPPQPRSTLRRRWLLITAIVLIFAVALIWTRMPKS